MAAKKKFDTGAAKNRSALGRGLSDLLTNEPIAATGNSSTISEINIDRIAVNPNQPRREFDPVALQELADSIREIGIIQPITLRKQSDNTYQIIAGERRYRASLLAGLTTIPAYIRTVDDENVMEMALIENIQREDLNALEIALAYQQLIEQYALTQERLSERVGKKRATIANYLRLLKLPTPIQVALQNKEIDMGHARALLTLSDPKQQIALFDEVVANGYAVREVEERANAMLNGTTAAASGDDSGKENANQKGKGNATPDEYALLQQHLSNFFQAKVKLSCNAKGKGKITIPFKNEQQLEQIIAMMDKLK